MTFDIDKQNKVFNGWDLLRKTASELTIAAGVITAIEGQSVYTVDTQSDDATDELLTINGGSEGRQIYLLLEDNARVVTIDVGAGNILGSADVVFPSSEFVELLFTNGNWTVQAGQSSAGEANTISDTDASGGDSIVQTVSKVVADLRLRQVLGSEGIQTSIDAPNQKVDFKSDISGLAADGAPSGPNDFVMTFDVSAGVHKKVLLDDLPSTGGGEANTIGNGASTGTKSILQVPSKSGIQLLLRKFNDFTDSGIKITEDEPNEKLDFEVDIAGTTALGGAPAAGDLFLIEDISAGILRTIPASALPSGSDVAVEVSGDDTTPGDLESKIAAGNAVSLATLNGGGNEQLEISATRIGVFRKLPITIDQWKPEPSNPGVFGTEELPTNKTVWSFFELDNNDAIQLQVSPPREYNNGVWRYFVKWDGDTGAVAAQTVTFQLSIVAIGNDDSRDVAFGTPVSSADQLIVVGDSHHSTISADVTPGGSAQSFDTLIFRLERTAGTLATAAKVTEVHLEYLESSTELSQMA